MRRRSLHSVHCHHVILPHFEQSLIQVPFDSSRFGRSRSARRFFHAVLLQPPALHLGLVSKHDQPQCGGDCDLTIHQTVANRIREQVFDGALYPVTVTVNTYTGYSVVNRQALALRFRYHACDRLVDEAIERVQRIFRLNAPSLEPGECRDR